MNVWMLRLFRSLSKIVTPALTFSPGTYPPLSSRARKEEVGGRGSGGLWALKEEGNRNRAHIVTSTFTLLFHSFNRGLGRGGIEENGPCKNESEGVTRLLLENLGSMTRFFLSSIRSPPPCHPFLSFLLGGSSRARQRRKI